jgi:hypothetical protein
MHPDLDFTPAQKKLPIKFSPPLRSGAPKARGASNWPQGWSVGEGRAPHRGEAP